MQDFRIEDVQRLVVRPGEILLVTIPAHTTVEDAEYIKGIFKAKLPEGVEVVVKTPDVDAAVVAGDTA
jgi:hypothetical protein